MGNKKRSMDSQLDFQPPTQHKRLRLSRECFLPMESSSANTHPMLSSWQQGPRSARPMPQQYPMRFEPFGSAPMSMCPNAPMPMGPDAPMPMGPDAPMPMCPDAPSCAMGMAATRRSTMGS